MIPDSFFITAAKALAELVTDEMTVRCSLYPPLDNIRECSFHIACAIAKAAFELKIAMEIEPKDVRELIKRSLYDFEKLPVFSHDNFEKMTKQFTGRASVYME